MYKVKMFSGSDLSNIERNINFFIDSNGLTDWEMVGNVSTAVIPNNREFEAETIYVATIRYWEGNNR